jgi:catechol 2,3-dioxygenase-like lactoylglutathione lyase family enzyme
MTRRFALPRNASVLRFVLAAVLAVATAPLWAEVRSIEGFALTVSDVERATAFYEAALGFKKLSQQLISDPSYDRLTGLSGTRVKSVTLVLGTDRIELNQFVSPAGRPIPQDSRSYDLWFQHMAIVVSDMDRAYRHVRNFPIQPISDGPQTIPESNAPAAGIKAYKFRDPDGHPLELLYFPPDKGRAKWHQNDGRLFLGIDHSAITVSSTEGSLSFYHNLLGLAVAGGSLNSGSTQEHLDAAAGAVVRVTGLRPTSADGPGLEFLQYLTPTGGRQIPAGTRVSDIAHVHAVLEVDDIAAVAAQLQAKHVVFVSPDIGSNKQLLVKDPDGHELLLVQR